MPAPTDHAVRRREVARAAVHSIARDGIDGATLRAVADEGGWSVGVVQHYFRNKSQLLAAAVGHMCERTWSVLDEHGGGTTALDRLHRSLQAINPQGRPAQVNLWRAWVCFWAQATNDPRLADALEDGARRWRASLAACIQAGQADGSIRPELSPEREATYLAAAIDGLGVNSTLDSSAPSLSGAADRLIEPLRSVALDAGDGAA